MKARLSLYATIVYSMIILSGCSKDEITAPVHDPVIDLLARTWKIQSRITDGVPLTLNSSQLAQRMNFTRSESKRNAGSVTDNEGYTGTRSLIPIGNPRQLKIDWKFVSAKTIHYTVHEISASRLDISMSTGTNVHRDVYVPQ